MAGSARRPSRRSLQYVDECHDGLPILLVAEPVEQTLRLLTKPSPRHLLQDKQPGKCRRRPQESRSQPELLRKPKTQYHKPLLAQNGLQERFFGDSLLV